MWSSLWMHISWTKCPHPYLQIWHSMNEQIFSSQVYMPHINDSIWWWYGLRAKNLAIIRRPSLGERLGKRFILVRRTTLQQEMFWGATVRCPSRRRPPWRPWCWSAWAWSPRQINVDKGRPKQTKKGGLQLGAHPGHNFHDDPGTGLLEHGHRRWVGDAFKALTVNC